MNKSFRRPTAVLALAGTLMCASVEARNSIANDWDDYYGPGGTSGIASNAMANMVAATGGNCQMCHRDSNGGSPWNAYGWAMLLAVSGNDWVAALMDVETLDSDGNGDANLVEIIADAQPGWTITGNIATFITSTTQPIPDQDIPAATPLDPVPDSDGDGIADDADNCLLQANPSQVDADADGIGNFCDPDFDQNCFVDFLDLGFVKSTFFGTDPDADLNSDGFVDFLDLGIVKQFFFGAPGPAAAPNGCP